MCRAEGTGLRDAVIGLEATFKVLARTRQGTPVSLPNNGSNLNISLTAEGSGLAVKGNVSAGSSVGEYLVRYVPVVAGRCKLDVQLEGEGIDQSPFTVTVASGTQTRLLRLVITCVRDE